MDKQYRPHTAYLARLRKAVQRYRSTFAENFLYDPAFIHCFCILYDLPSEVAIPLCCKILKQYISIFEVRWPEVYDYLHSPRHIIITIEEISQGELPQISELPALPDAPYILAGHGRSPVGMHRKAANYYLSAVNYLRAAVGVPVSNPGKRAALLHWAIWSYIMQRKNDVWAADDPLAYAADHHYLELAELSHILQDDQEIIYNAALRAAGWEYLSERGCDENIPANAVEWREWKKILDLLAPITRRFPDYPDMGTLERDLKLWEDNNYFDLTFNEEAVENL